METSELIKKAIAKVHKDISTGSIVVGTATDVTDTSCTVTREGYPDMQGVTLNAFDDNLESYATVVPKEGSLVIAGKINKDNQQGVVLCCSEVEKLIWKVGDSELVFDDTGWNIKRGSESLKKILDDLLEAILQLTVTTSTGPSGTPINFADFQAIKNRIPNLLT